MADNNENRFTNNLGTSVGEAKEIIKHHLEILWSHPECAEKVPPLMLWGPPGIGKSTIIRELANELGIGFIDVRLAQREPVDIRGLPVPRDDRQGVDWIVSSEWPREGQDDYNEQGIILFDEITAADPTLQVAAYEFILDRRLGKLYEVPKGWYILAAGNRTSDGAVARTMSSALANRFCHIELTTNAKNWIEWALLNGVDPSVIGFIRYRPDSLFNMTGNRERGWPSPRTWERVSLEVKLAKKTNLSKNSLQTIIEGLVGPGAGIEYFAFLQWAENIPDVEAMLRGEIKLDFPERSDRRFAFVSAVVHALLESQQPEDLVVGFLTFLIDIPNDWAQMAHHDITWTLSSLGRVEVLECIYENKMHEKLQDKIFIEE
jgi:hypothetical protein